MNIPLMPIMVNILIESLHSIYPKPIITLK